MEWVHTELAARFSETVLGRDLTPVPLPAGGALLFAGLAGFAVWGRRRKSQA